MESVLHVEDVCLEITPSSRVVFRKGVDHLGVSVACFRLFGKLFVCASSLIEALHAFCITSRVFVVASFCKLVLFSQTCLWFSSFF